MAEQMLSRAALLQLRRDHAVIDQGYRFLDEKRIALAQELMRGLAEHSRRLAEFSAANARARAAMAAALERHGLEGLQVYPPTSPDAWSLRRVERTFLGLRLSGEVELARERVSAAAQSSVPSAAAERCADVFAELCRLAAPLAALQSNLRRLAEDFRRTQRRVRALENVILPEVRADERHMEALLEELEQEELVRARLFAGAAAGPGRRDDGR